MIKHTVSFAVRTREGVVDITMSSSSSDTTDLVYDLRRKCGHEWLRGKIFEDRYANKNDLRLEQICTFCGEVSSIPYHEVEDAKVR